MKNRTLKLSITLVIMLFLNIEAAHAGLVHKLRIYIRHEIPDYALFTLLGGVFVFGALCYVVFTPILIGKEKWMWYNYFSNSTRQVDYQYKRQTVKKISGLLNSNLSGPAQA